MQATKNERGNIATTTPSRSLSPACGSLPEHLDRHKACVRLHDTLKSGHNAPRPFEPKGVLSQMRTTMSLPNNMRNNDMVLKLKSK